MRLLALVLIAVCISTMLTAQIKYVSTNGNDNNSGGASTP
jgi:hypothetical protein